MINSGIIKYNDKPWILSFEIYYNNTQCKGNNVYQIILYDGCNYNNTHNQQYETIYNRTVPISITPQLM